MAWADKLLVKKLHKYIAEFSKSNHLEAVENFKRIVADNIQYIEDEPSQSHMLACAYIMACYDRIIDSGVSQDVAIERLSYAFRQPGRLAMTCIMRLSLWFSRDSRKMIEVETTRKSKNYGAQFSFSEERGENHFISVVSKCGYHDFFVRNLRPELTRLFCEWDILWIDEIERQNNGIRFERPSTIGWGGSCCRFEFYFDENEG